MDPEKIKAALEAIKNGDAEAALALLEEMIASAAAGSAPDASGGPLAEPADTQMQTALCKLTGAPTAGEALLEVEKLVKLAEDVGKQRAEFDARVRRDLVGELVKLGIEFPATAWQGDAEKRVPVKRLADEPLDELRARVELHRKARVAPAAPPVAPPVGTVDGEREIATPLGVVKLSAREVANCKEAGAELEIYAANKAAMLKAQGLING